MIPAHIPSPPGQALPESIRSLYAPPLKFLGKWPPTPMDWASQGSIPPLGDNATASAYNHWRRALDLSFSVDVWLSYLQAPDRYASYQEEGAQPLMATMMMLRIFNSIVPGSQPSVVVQKHNCARRALMALDRWAAENAAGKPQTLPRPHKSAAPISR